MIIIGEKLNGSIPSVAKAIAEKDADLIRERARMQAEAGATFLDVCASVEEAVEVETLKWMIDCIQEVTDLPISVDSPAQMSLQKLTNSAESRVFLTLYPVKGIRSIRFFLLWHSLKIKGGRLSRF